ncbi:MAG TPA: sugar MFS transporter [Lacunisphaera sp.]|jgi:glucose/galactose transporter|nr:sugar MFS transporter [Lacunisphaera sp.]
MMDTAKVAPAPVHSAGRIVSISIIGALFFIFGFVTWLNGTLIPFLKLACDLQTDAQALLVTFAFYMAYFCLALPSAAILRRTGFKRGMSLGLAIMGVGALVFLPAALARSFTLFLGGLFVQGMGLALLQTASNPYISVLGSIESAASRISIMGICNKVAGALSPVILGAIVLKGASETEARIRGAATAAERIQLLQELSHRVIAPYAGMALVLFLLALVIVFSPLPVVEPDLEGHEDASGDRSRTSIWQFPHLLLGVVCIFVYVGVEVMAGDVIGPYARSLGLSLDYTKNLTAYTLWSMVAGYTIGVFMIPRHLRQETALKLSALTGMALAVAGFLSAGKTAVALVALLGFANSLMWPAIFPLAIDGLGRFTKTGSALLIMGIAGGAIVPQIYGRLALVVGTPAAFLACTLPCYIYILYYAVRGHRVGRPARG